jgi:bacteriocin-like protein
MLISKSQGEKLSDKDLQSIYGGCHCGNCDCSSSGGDKFMGIYDTSMADWAALFEEPFSG